MSNLVEKTDRNERVTEYVVDRRGRTIEENWLDGQTVVRSFEFEYSDGNELLSVSDPDAEYGFVYDGLGRTSEITADLAGFSSSIVMAQTFDVSSNRTRLAASVGTTADFVNDYTFDALSRMTRIERHGVGGGNTVAEMRIDLAYNAASQFTQIDRYADLAGEEFAMSTAFAYDGMGRLTSLDHSQGQTGLAGYAFTFDAASRITEIDSLIDGVTAYTYDTTNQLTAANFATQTDETHNWDENGNPDGGSFDVGPNNQVLTDGTYNYEYDDEGNRVLKTHIASGDTTEYVWDYRNRLVNVITRDDEENILQDVHYVYDFLNRWISREIDEDGEGVEEPTTEWFAFDGYQVVLSFDDAEAASPDKRWLNGPAVDQYFAEENAENDVLLLLGDHLNSTRDTALYNAGTEETVLKNHTLYTSFNARASDTDAAFASFIGETGRPHDPATGLDNHLNRWLDGWLKRWISEDPIGFAAGDCNLRRYVGNNASNVTDPSGLKWKISRTGGAWAVATATSDSDSIATLAAKIGLDVEEYRKWLKAEDNKPLPWPNRKAITCRNFLIPNTVEMYFQEGAWYDFTYILIYLRSSMTRRAIQLKLQGYKVAGKLYGNSAQEFKDMWKADGILAFVFVGHGDSLAKPSVGVDSAGESSVGPWDVHPPYKLAEVAILSCYSAQFGTNPGAAIGDNTVWGWSDHVSPGGRFVGFRGAVNMINFPFEQVEW